MRSFVAMKHGVETIRGLSYKLRMMGVRILGPLYVHVVKPESTLKKKSNSICYHAVCESVAMGEVLTTHIPTAMNPSDMLTKVLYGQNKQNCCEQVLWDSYDYGDRGQRGSCETLPREKAHTERY